MTASVAKNLCTGRANTTYSDFPVSKGSYLKLKARALSSMMNLHVAENTSSKLHGLLKEGDILFNCN